MRRFVLVVAAVVTAVGCTPSTVVQTALHGDLEALQQRIREAQAAGQLDDAEVEALAKAVAGREVRSAKGHLAVDRVRSARACLGPLVPVLRARAEGSDDAGAEALLALVDAGLADRREVLRSYREASSGAWRAAAARSAVGRRDGPIRRSFISDPDERVRRAALRAAFDGADPHDLPDLLEAARLDPDPRSRSLAARAAGAVGGERAVLGLADLWARAGQSTRMAIVDAWALPPSWTAGGRRELVRMAETTSSLPALAAAGALIRVGDGASRSIGTGVLTRAIAEGTWTERTLAIRLAPVDGPGVLDALREAAKEEHGDVRVVALARLSTHDVYGKKAVASLREIAKGKSDRARRARAALAAARDPSVTKWLRNDLESDSPGERILGAIGLLRLGRPALAAPALADDNPRVRMRVACFVLARGRRTAR